MAEENGEEYAASIWTFKFVVEGILMPTVTLFGILGNSLSIYILNNKDVKLKRDFVEVLVSMSAYDNLFLIGAFFLFSLPQLSGMIINNRKPFPEMTFMSRHLCL